MFNGAMSSEKINLIEKHLIERTMVLKKEGLRRNNYLNSISAILVGLGLWLIIDGVLSIIKYSKQSFPEQLIRVIRAAAGVIIIIIGLFQN
jgi:hypothetical protein